MNCFGDWLEGCVPRRMHRSVSVENQRSTWLSQDAEIGVRWAWNRGRSASQRLMARVGVVRQYADLNIDDPELSGWTKTADGILASLVRVCLRMVSESVHIRRWSSQRRYAKRRGLDNAP